MEPNLPLTICDTGHRVVPESAGRAADGGEACLALEWFGCCDVTILLLLREQLQAALDSLHWVAEKGVERH